MHDIIALWERVTHKWNPEDLINDQALVQTNYEFCLRIGSGPNGQNFSGEDGMEMCIFYGPRAGSLVGSKF